MTAAPYLTQSFPNRWLMKDGWGNPYSIGTQTVPEANTKILVIDCATAGKKDLDNQPFTRKLDFTNVAD